MTFFEKQRLYKYVKHAVVGILIAALSVGLIHTLVDKKIAEQDRAEWQRKADSALVFAATQDSIAGVERVRGDSIKLELGRMKFSRNVLAARYDSVMRNLPQVPTEVPDACLPWADRVRGLEAANAVQVVRIDSLKSEVATASDLAASRETEAAIQKRRADSLRTVLDSAPPVKKDPIVVFGPGVTFTPVFENGRFNVETRPGVSVIIPVRVDKVLLKALKALNPF